MCVAELRHAIEQRKRSKGGDLYHTLVCSPAVKRKKKRKRNRGRQSDDQHVEELHEKLGGRERTTPPPPPELCPPGPVKVWTEWKPKAEEEVTVFHFFHGDLGFHNDFVALAGELYGVQTTPRPGTATTGGNMAGRAGHNLT